MADLTPFAGMEVEHADVRTLNAAVLANPDNYPAWEKLAIAAEDLEGGIGRNSSPQAIASVRAIYDALLAKYPLLYGFWTKYANHEWEIAGTEAGEMVYERAVAAVRNSADLWAAYCKFKSETCHDVDLIREVFERGAEGAGLDYHGTTFWDTYIEWEERNENPEQIYKLLGRLASIPMHQYTRYFERYRHMAATLPLESVADAATLQQFRTDIGYDGAPISTLQMERDLRGRVDTALYQIYVKNQGEVNKRWTFEQEIRRPYFTADDLEASELANWRNYLSFEEKEGNYERIVFLYERCLVAAAKYEEFWLRYVRWMSAQPGKEEEVRNIYQRASCIFLPIAEPTARLNYAYFEEASGNIHIARAIHEAILMTYPSHVPTVMSWAYLERRHGGADALDNALSVIYNHIESPSLDAHTRGVIVVEAAKFLWKYKGSEEDSRQLYLTKKQDFGGVGAFWIGYLKFEIDLPSRADIEHERREHVKAVFDEALRSCDIDVVKELAQMYMTYILERCSATEVQEYLKLDYQLHGPAPFQAMPMGAVSSANVTTGDEIMRFA
ncbi:hypothetical protein K402DRAFT_392559 [Aulographum hederae CBS 113979]|uniref:Pre-mRNA-processing factor 39 n=1 Tax=Aulographum hederae CBS 113979 TaxID=1176131 RepID=A0A6G1H3F7_9PEZI|nr:hypothetical protein K402DRAFT_392559 [Aulographum hederae CBS 113979]